MCQQRVGEDGCKITPSRPLVFQTGRKDCVVTNTKRPFEDSEVDELPDDASNGSATVTYMEKEFGFTARETVAIMGAHTVGAFHQEVTGHKYVWTTDWLTFNNQFYRNIVGKREWFFDDNECTKVGDAFQNRGVAIWVAKKNWIYKSGGPIQWIQNKLVCPNCEKVLSDEWKNRDVKTRFRKERSVTDEECCKNRNTTNREFCKPDNYAWTEHESDKTTAEQRDKDKSGGCEYSHHIEGRDESALPSDMGLMWAFDVDNETGFPSGCPGLRHFKPNTSDEGGRQSNQVCKHDLSKTGKNMDLKEKEWRAEGCPSDCEKNGYVHNPDQDKRSLSEHFEEFADNQDLWIGEFFFAMEKMLSNKYTEGQLRVSWPPSQNQHTSSSTNY